MHRFIILFGFIAALGVSSVIFAALGYYAHREQFEPAFSLAERIIVKGRRTLGMPTQTVGLVERIETTYLTMRGTTYLMPDNDFLNGGALALWGDDTLVMHKSGNIFYLDEGRGLIKTPISVPDNGIQGYAELGASKFPNQPTRLKSIRFNDLEFVEEGVLRGLLLSYTFIDVQNECYRTRVSWLDIPSEVSSIREVTANPEDWDMVFETSPCLAFNPSRELIVGYMAGGRLAFKAPNLVYLGSGEYHLDGIYRPDAGIMSEDSDYGKTIEIDLTTGEARHFSVGHRNLQGVVLDAKGRLWTTEHGMRGGDELNLIVDGENYGWPLENLGTLYSGIPAPSVGGVGRHEVYPAPVYAWLPSAAVSSLALVEGFHEAWDGDLLIGSLSARTLFRARIQGDRLVFMEEIPIGQRIRDVMQVAPDRLALWLDTNELVIFEIVERTDPLAGLKDGLVEDGMESKLAEAVHGTLEGCSECHSFEKDIHGAGPSLYDIAGRAIASTAFADYTDALRSSSGAWDHAALTLYLTDPTAFVTGTSMTGLGVGSKELAAGLSTGFSWLKAQNDQ